MRVDKYQVAGFAQRLSSKGIKYYVLRITYYIRYFLSILSVAPVSTLISPLSSDRLIAALMVALALLGWEGLVWLNKTPVYLLPAPSAILRKLLAAPWPLLAAGGVTLAEALTGLLLGGAVGLGLALLLNFWARLEHGILSLAILIKATPIIAIAPILTVWFGFGPAPKVVVTALLGAH
jgi:NitT/TauT family transport system permease protein